MEIRVVWGAEERRRRGLGTEEEEATDEVDFVGEIDAKLELKVVNHGV